MKKQFPIIAIFFIVSCTPHTKIIKHNYEIRVVDKDNNPLIGAIIKYKLWDTYNNKNKIIKDTVYTTSGSCILRDSLIVSRGKDEFRKTYYAGNNFHDGLWISGIDYEINKDGFFPQMGYLKYENVSKKGKFGKIEKGERKKLIKLIKAEDYFNRYFASSSQNQSLLNLLRNFINDITIHSYFSECYLEYKSIDLLNYEDKRYISFNIVSVNIYNSLKFGMYDIGKELFFSIVKKILKPLNDNLQEYQNFYGYDVTVMGKTKNFRDKNSIPNIIYYRFLMPKELVLKYINKNIRSQDLFNDSIILMNNERIKLDLQ